MLNQRQMKEWIPEAVGHFKSIMPEIDVPYPEIHIVSANKAQETRDQIVERLHSRQNLFIYPGRMETIHGEFGDAILIYQKNVKENTFGITDEKAIFQHCLWHELGQFFCIYMECPDDNLFRYMDHKVYLEDFISQLGYWFWSGFTSEVIACRCDPDADVDWNTSDWHPVRNGLAILLRDTFNKYEDFIDQYSIACYYAKILADKRVRSYIEAANNGTLLTAEASGGNERMVTFREAGIDPTFMADVPDYYHPVLNELQKKLEVQLSQELYWKTNIDFVTDIGHMIEELRNIKLMHSSQKTFGKLLQGLSGGADNT